MLLRFAIKSSLAGGIVYYTVHEGLWSRSEESVKVYAKLYNNIAPLIKHNLPKEVVHEFSELPSTGDVSNFLQTSWNKGVMASMRYISEIPTHASNGVTSLNEAVQKYMNQQN